MFDTVKVFSATKAKERAELGDRMTDWLRRTQPKIVDKQVLQSSDSEFHCLTVIFFYNGGKNEKERTSQRR